jgi:hypothetical protein
MDITAIPKKVEDAIDRLKQLPPGNDRLKPDEGPMDRSVPPGEARHRERDRQLLLHMLTTYRLLRRGMGWLAIAYPIALAAIGYFVFNIALQPSISDYYYALPRDVALPPGCLVGTPPLPCAKTFDISFPVRSFFCGGLFSIGVFLVLYQGTSWLEDWALDLAGLFAIGVAIFPMNSVAFTTVWPTWLHFASAILLFICMWFISRYCAKDTLQYFDDDLPTIEYYTNLYKRLSWLMLAVLIAGAVYFVAKDVLDPLFPWLLFCIETAGIVVFGSYWVFKSKEISKHKFKRQ